MFDLLPKLNNPHVFFAWGLFVLLSQNLTLLRRGLRGPCVTKVNWIFQRKQQRFEEWFVRFCRYDIAVKIVICHPLVHNLKNVPYTCGWFDCTRWRSAVFLIFTIRVLRIFSNIDDFFFWYFDDDLPHFFEEKWHF